MKKNNISKKKVKSELSKTIRKTLDNKLNELTRGNLSPKELLEMISQNYKLKKLELNAL